MAMKNCQDGTQVIKIQKYYTGFHAKAVNLMRQVLKCNPNLKYCFIANAYKNYVIAASCTFKNNLLFSPK